MYKTLFSLCLYVCTFWSVCVCMYVRNCNSIGWFFNVEFLQVRLLLVDETVFSLYLL